MSTLEKHELVIGFIPLTDCATIIIAQELGFFAAQELDVTLSREGSWASIRDKITFGLLDAAHMLAPMPLASTLGVGGPATPMLTAISLGLNGNAVTVSPALADAMRNADPAAPDSPTALGKVIAADRLDGRAPLTFGVVFPASMHNYLLRYWLATAGIDPDHDVNLIVVPPPQMVERLEVGHLDGFCVGEPWNVAAAAAGLGRVVTTGYAIWNNAPEKVLGVTRHWAEENPNTHAALVRALVQAAVWLDQPEHHEEAATILSRPEHVGVSAELIQQALASSHVFFRCAANFPWRSHAVWQLTQMLRWGHVSRSIHLRATAEAVYRTDLYRAAVAPLGVSCPRTDTKDEGVHAEPWVAPGTAGDIQLGVDRFVDGKVFSAGDPLSYLRQHRLSRVTALDELAVDA